MVCGICNDARARKKTDFDDVPFADLKRSGQNCRICLVLSATLKEQLNFGTGDALRISNDTSIYHNRPTDGLHLLVSKGGQQYTTDMFVIRNLVGPKEKDLLTVIHSGCPPTGSPLAVDWAQSQIAECLAHPACNASQYAFLPDRVLSISGSGEASTDLQVRLFESTGESRKYATLSHMWGGHQPLRLLKGNVKDFRTNIPWSDLPKTFQESIQFTKQLGIDYIWIDSLCIIQDSPTDWREQSGKMASIYENSYITLAAAVSESSLAGCFRKPDPFLTGWVTTNGADKIPVNDSERIQAILSSPTSDPVIFVRGSPKHRSPSRLESNPLPLLERGWVNQERLLSPRVLFFGDIDLLWECNESIACYCKTWSHSYSRNVRSHPVKSQHAMSLRLGKPDLPTAKPSEMAGRWSRIVEEYSALKLTFMKDQLPAMAGIAKQFARTVPGSTYASGMWSAFLVEGLAWSVKDYPLPQRHPDAKKTKSPSWSWIAPMARVIYPSGWFAPESATVPTVVGTDFAQEGIDPFMDVTIGGIILKGHLCEVRVRDLTTDSDYMPVKRGVSVVGRKGFWQTVHLDADDEAWEWKSIRPRWLQNLLVDVKVSNSLGGYRALEPEEDLDEEVPVVLIGDKVVSVRQIPQRFWCFAIGRYLDEGARSEAYLLLECIDELKQIYRRVGYRQCSVDGSIWVKMKDAKHTITIV